MKVFVVIINDRHLDLNISVFSSLDQALVYSNDYISSHAEDSSEFHQWELHSLGSICVYSIEDDYVLISEREVK